ncbi:hypothetical protein SLEP1_g5458 [Rubroshorea leprosula]|uniref:Uncharacterized protein n=1 Tax=Rubroshorea leprosula TaxID=152421 RepID=A0AAV5I0U8_9ROSI|nr:hypothetical protein SLEP1_g5458 [Rubroshorea leprosula]
MILNAGQNLVDLRGRLLPRSYDMLGLYTTFIFQKPDPDVVPPLSTPLLQDSHDEAKWQAPSWRDDENGHPEPPPAAAPPPPPPPLGLGNISDQKGILGPGPADLRFSEAL